MRWIYLSPHPDDAALCAGGLIFEQARRAEVQIWTLFAGIPPRERLSDFATEMHGKWGTKTARETVRMRREEDFSVEAVLRARVRHFDFLDAIYRLGADGEALYGDPVGAALDPADGPLQRQIAGELSRRLLPLDRVVCLLGIGGHVDHLIVRAAAESLGVPLRYVADFPYILKHPDSVEGAAAGLTKLLAPLSEAAVAAWVQAVRCYRSQLRAVFDDLDEESAIREYWKAANGLRFWEAVPSAEAAEA